MLEKGKEGKRLVVVVVDLVDGVIGKGVVQKLF